jgi:hypothetical protein
MLYTQVVMNNPSTSQIKEAFVQAALAEDEAKQVKENLIRLHYLSEEVDNATFLVENMGRIAEPSADAHDVLFQRLTKAKEDLARVIREDGMLGEVKKGLERTYVASESAFHILK